MGVGWGMGVGWWWWWWWFTVLCVQIYVSWLPSSLERMRVFLPLQRLLENYLVCEGIIMTCLLADCAV